jgi:hypothetical protein
MHVGLCSAVLSWAFCAWGWLLGGCVVVQCFCKVLWWCAWVDAYAGCVGDELYPADGLQHFASAGAPIRACWALILG